MFKIADSLVIGWFCVDRMASSSAAGKRNALQGSAGVVSTSSSSSATSSKGQAKAKAKVRIDIDDDIEEATKVTAMLKKIQKKAVTMNKNQQEEEAADRTEGQQAPSRGSRAHCCPQEVRDVRSRRRDRPDDE